jgi:predicted TIM-barrel fold metal-dependent hydrolase
LTISRRLELTTPVVDNHAHPLTLTQPQDPTSFRRAFSEAPHPSLARDHVPWTVYYHWGLRDLANLLHIEPSEEALLTRRGAEPFAEYARFLVQDAGIAWLLLDEGFPPPDEVYTSRRMEEILGVRVGRILRLEVLAADLIVRHAHFADVVDAFDLRVARARGDGYIALKSIAAYRTGLAIEPVSAREAEEAFVPVRRQAEDRGSLRLASKTLIDFFVLRALGHAAAAELPVQFHTGYGDPDLDLRLANPLHLRPIFEDPTLAGAPIVLLHESYPYTAEAAYLAVSYPNAYLDIAYTLPPLDRLELIRVTGIALGAAPASKILVSSDGVGIPEQYWLGAIRARDVVGRVLGAMIDAGEIGADVGEEMGRMILHDNAVRLYGLT